MNVQQYPLKKGQYFPDLTAKKFVVWHGTAGRTMHTRVSGRPGKATTSIDGWNLTADRVGAPWLVDRDGTIYETFNDAGWIYHLGLKGTKGQYDKQSVAIEFANEGTQHIPIKKPRQRAAVVAARTLPSRRRPSR